MNLTIREPDIFCSVLKDQKPLFDAAKKSVQLEKIKKVCKQKKFPQHLTISLGIQDRNRITAFKKGCSLIWEAYEAQRITCEHQLRRNECATYFFRLLLLEREHIFFDH